MKMMIAMAAAALCCTVLAEGEGQAQRPHRGGAGGPHAEMRYSEGMPDPLIRAVLNPKIAETLGLTDEQKEKLKAVTEGARGARDGMRKVREATMKQVELMKADKIDEEAVLKAIDEVFEIRKQMARDQVKRLIAVKSILTPEQVAKAREGMRSRGGARGPRRGPQGGRRGKGGAGAPPPPADGGATAP